MATVSNLLGLDVGEKRIGVAIVADGLAVPRSMPALQNDETFRSKLDAIIADKKIEQVIIGLPRNLNGQDTPQTVAVREFAIRLGADLGLPIHLQDEALTSEIAENILKADQNHYEKGEIDSLAACHILLDYLGGNA